MAFPLRLMKRQHWFHYPISSPEGKPLPFYPSLSIVLFSLIGLGFSFLLFPHYHPEWTSLCLLLISLYLLPKTTVNKPFHLFTYAFLGLFFLVGHCFIPNQMMLYLCFLFLIASFLQGFSISLHPHLIFQACLISPGIKYAVQTFTFPIRLHLSEISALGLKNFLIPGIQQDGNQFILPDGSTFAVDEQCMGVNMLITGIQVGIIVFFYFHKDKALKHQIGLGFLFAIFGALFLWLTNILRIICLVYFRCLPETSAHTLIGLISFAIYFLLPCYLLAWGLSRFGKRKAETQQQAFRFRIHPAFYLIPMSMLFYFQCTKGKANLDIDLVQLELKGFQKKAEKDGVFSFRNQEVLVYIKPQVHPLAADHPPFLCWKGSGFKVTQFKSHRHGAHSYHTAILQKGKAIQYTAWWYDNGRIKTNSSWEWRSSKGVPFRLINITCLDEKTLQKNIPHFLSLSLFSSTKKGE